MTLRDFTLENRVAVPQKVKPRVTMRPSSSSPGSAPDRNANICTRVRSSMFITAKK